MPDLWLLRHGDAERDAPTDAERRLTSKGERQARDAGGALAALGAEFGTVFTSPRVRALDTARLACESLGLEPVVHEPLSGGFDAEQARELLGDEPVLLVGHEPDFSQIVADLTGGRVDLKKGGLAVIRVEGGGGELRVLARPAELSLIAKSGR
jgi:phosphohistidine phosphatase